MCELWFELFNHRTGFTEDSSKVLQEWFGSQLIPYLSPTNSPWPIELSRVPGVCVAALEQSADQAQIKLCVLDCKEEETKASVEKNINCQAAASDNTSDVGFAAETQEELDACQDEIARPKSVDNTAFIPLSGETKHRKQRISLLSMIKKIPSDSKLHVLLTRAAITDVPPSTRMAIKRQKVLLLKLTLEQSRWHLEPLFEDQDLSQSDGVCVVILIEVLNLCAAVSTLQRARKRT